MTAVASLLKWFPFYIDDWETDERVRALTYEERGVYLAMLCWQWREGTIPERPKDVTVTLRARPATVTKLLRSFFRDDGTQSGRVVNMRLEQVREQQVSRLQRDKEKAAAYRRRARGRNGDVTDPSRARSRIRSEIETSLSASHREKATA